MQATALAAISPRKVTAIEHNYVTDHKVLRALKDYARDKKRLEVSAQLRSSAEVAAERLREFAWDIGSQLGFRRGWKAYACREMGLKYGTGWTLIMMGLGTSPRTLEKHTVSAKTVDTVARNTGVPVRVFYDSEL
jgi:hypothetical protein